MKPWLFNIELAVDRLLPYLLIIMVFLVVGDIFYPEQVERYAAAANGLDVFVISMFVVDMAFKYSRAANAKDFLRHYWLDIIAILPAFLFVRVVEEALLLSEETIARTQRALHAGVELEKEGILVAQQAESVARASRLRLAARLIRPIQRVPRLLKAFTFYEKPTHTKHKA